MGAKEAEVEKYLNDRVVAAGGMTRKWTSPGHVGVPDRIVFMPRGVVVFVEVKTDNGRLSSPQEREINRLKEMGTNVTTVYGKSDVKKLVDQLLQCYADAL